MAGQSVDNNNKPLHTHPFVRVYPKFFPKDAQGKAVAPNLADVMTHPCGQPGVVMPTEGFSSRALVAPTNLTTAENSVVRQGEVLKQQVGAGRHALQYIATGSVLLGLTVACAGHPLAGLAVAAVGLLVGFGVREYVRQRALKKVGTNGNTGEDFKKSFEALLTERGGVLNDPALETSRKMYDFLTRTPWEDFKHDAVAPLKRAAVGSLNLAKAGLSKVFSSTPKAQAPVQDA